MCVYMCLSKCMCTCVNAMSICDGFVNLQEEYKFAKLKQTTVYKQLTQGRRNVFTTGLAKLDDEDEDYAIKCVGGRQLHEY